jgi:predicted dehydrogenase
MKLCAIGCGQHAWSSHGPAQARYAAEHPELRLAGCCDLELARAQTYAERFGFTKAYAEVAEMLDADRPDAVVLVVPDALTAALGQEVLERGLPLLLEKPPGRSVSECDRLIAAAEHGKRQPVPHQVAFNRRYAPLVQELRRRLVALGGPREIQHVHYEMTRLDRRDPDFSVTAIHGIDAVRFLAGSDFAHVRFRYHERADLGPGVANILMDAAMSSGATAHLAFCPVAGVVVERATVHALGHTFFLHVPMWGAVDSPGRLQHFEGGALASECSGDAAGTGTTPFELGGFYAEYEAFLGDLAAGRAPTPTLRDSRQSVEVAEHIRHRKSEFRA